MQNIKKLEKFNLYVELMIDALKLQNEALVKSLEELVIELNTFEYTSDILMAALLQLSETDADTCRWTLRNFHDSPIHLDITGEIAIFAVKKLIDKGLIFGQDFSTTLNNRIVINKNASNALKKGTSDAEFLLFGGISQVVEAGFSPEK